MRGTAPKITISTHDGQVVEVLDLGDYEPPMGQWTDRVSWTALSADVREAVERTYRIQYPELAEHGLLP